MFSRNLNHLGAGLLLLGLTACQKGVDLGTQAPAPGPTPVVRQVEASPAPPGTSAPGPAPGASPAPSVKPGEVPEMMKRAFTKEEMDKAMDQLPPEIRSRLKGLSYAPSTINAQIPVKATPSPSPKKR